MELEGLSSRQMKWAKMIEWGQFGPDSTTFFLTEKHYERSKKTVLVADWTSSMYPYTLQTLHWAKIRKPWPFQHLILFNDGNDTPDEEKKIGQTGGFYVSQNTELAHLFALMDSCERGGSGGDFPENDVEALLFAEKQFPEAEALTLIADGNSVIRDLELAEKLKKPVHIFLARSLNHDGYFQLALATGGSVHTREADYESEESLRTQIRLLNQSEKERQRAIREAERESRKLKRGR